MERRYTDERTKKTIKSLMQIALVTLFLMAIYQAVKDELFPNETLLQSHIITTIFTTILATVVAYFVLRERDELFQRATEEIAERKRSEEALKQSEEKYRTLFETMTQGVVYQDANGKIISANPAAERLLGLTLDQMQARTSTDPRWRSIHEDGSPFPGETHPAMVALRTGEEVRNVVMGVFDPKENRYRWININAAPQFRPGEGRPYQVYATFDDITERKRAKELSDALNSINASISSTLDFNEIMQRVVVDAVKAIGSERGVVLLREEDHWVAGYTYGFPEGVAGTRLTDDEAKHAVIAAQIRGPVIINNTSADERVNPKVMARFGIGSLLAVPLIVRKDVIGALCFCYHSGPVMFSEEQVDFAQKLSLSVSLALENARLYASERRVADTLQDALLTIPDHVDHLRYGRLYRSATEAARVGGDFYDLFELEHNRVGITIGDVSGKGIESATLTAVVKNTIRAYALEGYSPAEVMDKTNSALRGVVGPALFITVFFGILNLNTGELTYCSAGHPPAIIKRGSIGTEILLTLSPMIGAFAGLSYTQATTTLEEDDILVLYTDGVIEARCAGEFFGDERLVQFIGGLGSVQAEEMPQLIFEEVMRCTHGKLSDDLALFTISTTRT